MRSRSLLVAAIAVAAAIAPAAAQATTISLAPDATNTGQWTKVDDSTFFVPRSNHGMLVLGTFADNAGQPGDTCFHMLWRTMAEADFGQHLDGVECPTDSSGHFSWTPPLNENQQYKAVTVADDNNTATESNVITFLTAPDLWWSMGYRGNTQVLTASFQGDADDFDGTLAVSQGGRVVASAHVTGTTGQLEVRVAAPKRRHHRAAKCGGCLKSGAAFTATLTPSQTARWQTMRATGRVVRGQQGDGTPVL